MNERSSRTLFIISFAAVTIVTSFGTGLGCSVLPAEASPPGMANCADERVPPWLRITGPVSCVMGDAQKGLCGRIGIVVLVEAPTGVPPADAATLCPLKASLALGLPGTPPLRARSRTDTGVALPLPEKDSWPATCRALSPTAFIFNERIGT